ncbi:DUF488 domain-containing protein [Enterococcus gallinarum]|uniref:DUF488 domain-containing protein n=1 Tax=Enterococcus gallinarum TaxID=1353 RepID=UPI0035BC2FDA
MIKVKRVYEAAAPTDGYRVLVDRIWPRGVKKEVAAIDSWLKEVAPSTELRKWFGHDPERFDAFCQRYLAELKKKPADDAFSALQQIVKDHKTVTLVYGAKDETHNQAVVLTRDTFTHSSFSFFFI